MITQLGLLEQTFTDPSSPSLLMETLSHRWGTCQAAYVVIASTKMVEATHLGIAEKVCYSWDSGGGGTVAAIKLVHIQPLLEQDRVHRGDPRV